MRKIIAGIAILASIVSGAQETNYKVVPVISSNPTAGTGAGLSGSMMYTVDDSSPSQAIVTGQYTDTDSYSAFVVNKMFFNDDHWQSNSVLIYLFNNSSFSIDLPVDLPIYGDTIEPHFEVTVYGAFEQLLYRPIEHWYVGGHIFYLSQSFKATDEEGALFLIRNGITDSNRGGFGGVVSYDTRSDTEKFYPVDATLVNLNVNAFPSFLGSGESFYNVMINARLYIPGWSQGDVFATQFFGQYCSENTPDGALSALGARNILRGFPIGKYKTRYLSALQGEYRYTLGESRFRFVLFGGYARLDGGSKGTEYGNRDRDNGNYYSGGTGVHYVLSKEYGLDYRIDVALSSDSEVSVYAMINQAF